MTKQPRRGHCARCGRPAAVEVVYQPRRADGVLADPVAERLCDRHRRPKGDGLTMQVRTLDARSTTAPTDGPVADDGPVAAAPGARGDGRPSGEGSPRRRRRLFPGNRQPWTPLSLLADRPSEAPPGGG